MALLVIPTMISRHHQKSWLSPGALLPLFWIFVFAVTVLLTPDYILLTAGTVWITFGIFVFSMASLMRPPRLSAPSPRYDSLSSGIKRVPRSVQRGTKRLARLAVIFAGLGMLEPIVLARAAGYSVVALLNPANLANVAHFYTNSRYTSLTYREPGAAVLASTFLFASAIVAGALIALKPARRRERLAGIAPFVPALATTLLLTTRSVFLTTSIAWASAYLAMLVARTRGKYSLFSFRALSRTALMVGTAVAVFVLAFIVRGGIAGVTPSQAGPDTFSGLLGSPSAFSIWFNEEGSGILTPIGLGSRTLSGPLGMVLHTSRTYFPPLVVGKDPRHSSPTTIRTLFGDLIYDYSLFGSLVILATGGLVAGAAYRGALVGRTVHVLVLAALYSTVLSSSGGLPFTYTTVLVAWLMAGFLIFRTLGSKVPGPELAEVAAPDGQAPPPVKREGSGNERGRFLGA